MKISRTYYIRNPKNLGKADAEFQASWGLKRKDDDIKYIRADQVKALVEAANALIKSAAGAYNEKRTNVSKHKFKALRQALAAMEAEGKGIASACM